MDIETRATWQQQRLRLVKKAHFALLQSLHAKVECGGVARVWRCMSMLGQAESPKSAGIEGQRICRYLRL